MTESSTSLKEVRTFRESLNDFVSHIHTHTHTIIQNSMQKTVAVSEQKEMKTSKKLEGAELIAEFRRIVENAFERDNLSNNHHLVSKMNSQMFVPLSVVLEMESVRELSVSDEDILKKAMEGSKMCVLDASGDMIKPSFKVERNTIILREVPADATEKEVCDSLSLFTSLSLSLHTLVKFDGGVFLVEACSYSFELLRVWYIDSQLFLLSNPLDRSDFRFYSWLSLHATS